MPRAVTSEPAADPFGERHRPRLQMRAHVLGGEFCFQCDHPQLLRIATAAYAALPPQRMPRAPRCTVRLTLLPEPQRAGGAPPPVAALSGAGLLCGAVGGSSFVAVSPQRRSALVAVDRRLLRFPYHLRYELLEFAVYTLAARARGLMPLHAGCVGERGRGALLIGASGAGKSTATLHCLLAGMDFMAEDSVMMRPKGLLATGVASFLHLRRQSLRHLGAASRAALLRHASLIRRRSGVEKLEIDLRAARYRLAGAPLPIRAVVFLSPKPAGARTLLTPLRRADVLRRLAASQRYAAQRPGWASFAQRLSRLPGYELRRGAHPGAAVLAIRAALAQGQGRRARVAGAGP
jgi:hypothetical protein